MGRCAPRMHSAIATFMQPSTRQVPFLTVDRGAIVGTACPSFGRYSVLMRASSQSHSICAGAAPISFAATPANRRMTFGASSAGSPFCLISGRNAPLSGRNAVEVPH